MLQSTLVLIKPDALQRAIAGQIISRFENKGLKIVALKMIKLTQKECEEHYSHLKSKPFYNSLVEFMTSGPIIAMVLEGPNAVLVVRQLCGVTDGKQAQAGTIRGDFSVSTQFNVIHASDSEETAKKEIERFFNKKEIFKWDKKIDSMLFTDQEAKS
jgi:nucleoside-diphosphate kinase